MNKVPAMLGLIDDLTCQQSPSVFVGQNRDSVTIRFFEASNVVVRLFGSKQTAQRHRHRHLLQQLLMESPLPPSAGFKTFALSPIVLEQCAYGLYQIRGDHVEVGRVFE